ncbi:hypothetical protein F7734_56240 [Scytonema sp. UIC 10036]|uniref:hypothetical protein n=1 Tax=Scytonema sp. UIC 10036 TaxID=2304196 RepID=UPI0012DAB614|nr:hypothetical protein [Scytonema sp. UIC 10036]MUH01128.1 hypothetical protein [Scytonema sp. UIC 10036]
MNPKFIWQSKHLGLGVGIALSGLGLFLAVPENMNTWIKVQKTYTIGSFEFQDTTHIRINETTPQGYAVVELIPGKTEYKALGTGLMFLGSVLSLCFSSILVKEYERIEQSNYRLRQSEFELEDLHLDQTTEVARWAIELDAQADISKMLNPPKAYLPDSEEDEPDNDKFSETSTGFLGWLKTKNLDTSHIKVSQVGSLSFNGRKLKADEIRKFVDELVTSEVAEWLDDKKSEFRLLSQ